MKLDFSRQIFEKYRNIKFHENPLSEAESFYGTDRQTQTDRQTEKHGESNSRFSQFFESA